VVTYEKETRSSYEQFFRSYEQFFRSYEQFLRSYEQFLRSYELVRFRPVKKEM
jgi:hypothetical protein